jgi:hypothetical protein
MRAGVGLWRTGQSCGKRPDTLVGSGREGIELEGLGVGAHELERWEGKTGVRWKTPGIQGDRSGSLGMGCGQGNGAVGWCWRFVPHGTFSVWAETDFGPGLILFHVEHEYDGRLDFSQICGRRLAKIRKRRMQIPIRPRRAVKGGFR